LLFGFAGQVDGLVQRITAELAPGAEAGVTVVATGGLAPLLIAESRTITHHAPHLTLQGLRMVFERNIGS
jgi:type III pantothenate kinase